MGFTTNRSILEKANLVLSDLTVGDGILKPDQALKFMRLLVKESVLLKQITVVPMRAPKQAQSKIRFGSRVLRPGKELTSVTAADRAKPDISSFELDAKLFKAEVLISDEVLEDNLERGQLRQTIMDLLAEAIARDMEDVVINGNTASPDPVLAVLDGVLVQAQSHIVDATGAPISKSLLADLLKALPSEYLRDKKALRFFTSTNADAEYRNALAERATGAGDKYLETDAPVMASGIPLAPLPLFPEDLGPNKDQTAILLCHPKNIHVGIWRQVRIETAREISEGGLKIVATLRFDAKFSDEPAVAKVVNIAS